MKRSVILALWMLSLLTISFPMEKANAEGPGTGGRRIRLDGEVAGPYSFRVVTSPTPPRVENLYLEVRVVEAATENILTDLIVTVVASSTEGEDTQIEAIATHDIAPIPDEYAAHVPVPRPGVWSIVVQAEGSLGTAQVSFLERVSSPTSLSPIISVGVPFAGLGILIFLFWRMQGKPEDESRV